MQYWYKLPLSQSLTLSTHSELLYRIDTTPFHDVRNKLWKRKRKKMHWNENVYFIIGSNFRSCHVFYSGMYGVLMLLVNTLCQRRWQLFATLIPVSWSKHLTHTHTIALRKRERVRKMHRIHWYIMTHQMIEMKASQCWCNHWHYSYSQLSFSPPLLFLSLSVDWFVCFSLTTSFACLYNRLTQFIYGNGFCFNLIASHSHNLTFSMDSFNSLSFFLVYVNEESPSENDTSNTCVDTIRNRHWERENEKANDALVTQWVLKQNSIPIFRSVSIFY